MSDLVGNPEDQFSRVAAQIILDSFGGLLRHFPQFSSDSKMQEQFRIKIEPVHEKTNNLGFRPGPTQTRLHSHTIKLEA